MSAVGRALTTLRGLALQTFLLDDGWDNRRALWQVHSGFPAGMQPLQRLAQAYNASLGVWLSPWGGYAGFGGAAGYLAVLMLFIYATQT
jgi:hypothetical protein